MRSVSDGTSMHQKAPSELELRLKVRLVGCSLPKNPSRGYHPIFRRRVDENEVMSKVKCRRCGELRAETQRSSVLANPSCQNVSGSTALSVKLAAILQLSQYCTFDGDSISTVITEPGQPVKSSSPVAPLRSAALVIHP
ncbi:putative tyrosine-protein phosphatase auxilin [Scophthalmus maximus]|uniref:Putative tyrosine-protein phosphatase auxilin n=1 Tax=Scophthalmus maximus TaxID=52904 RepID=A0A2U9C3M5_SCOMX|nr:putative tyrosine-protein phosphatase auxilin [Scophthalmus maximus]